VTKARRRAVDYRAGVPVREYDADEIRAAFAAALGSDTAEDPAGLDLRAPDGLATAVALELAQSTVTAAGPAREREVADGATACLCGMLVSAQLPPAQPGLADLLPDGIATVRSFGRHAVIARQCDLGAVAEMETALERVLGRGRRTAESTLQLFELGFAIGLGARPWSSAEQPAQA
jgi:hypothetical protein